MRKSNPCPKCGSIQRNVQWHSDRGPETTPALGWTGTLPMQGIPVHYARPRCGATEIQVAGEHLHVHCGTCGFDWSEAVEEPRWTGLQGASIERCPDWLAGIQCGRYRGHHGSHNAYDLFHEMVVEWFPGSPKDRRP